MAERHTNALTDKKELKKLALTDKKVKKELALAKKELEKLKELTKKPTRKNSTLEADYQKALELGQVLVAYARVMLVGPGGVGKSSLLRGLMNLPLPQAANSTQLADLITVKPQQQPITQQLMTKATDKSMPWVKVTDDDEINEIVGLILLVANVEKDVTKSLRFQGTAAYAASKIIHRHNVTDDFRQQISKIKNDVVREVFSRAIELAKMNPHAQAPESEIITNVWDCAGQLVYLDILSAFLTLKTIFMLLYDARKDLNDRCIVLSHHRGQVTNIQEQNMSYLEMLFQLMSSIHVTLTNNTSGSIPEYPHIITVGTHGDDPQVEARKSKIIETLFNKCEGKAFTHLIRKVYIVNNNSAGKGDNEDPTFKKIRKDVYQFASQPSVTIATPVAWVLFRKILQRAAQKKPIFSREETLEIAVSCSIPPKSFDSVLKFYHDVAVFLYFDYIPTMKDYVIACPQWLVKQLAKLLALEGFEEYDNPALWNLLRKQGILVEPLYTQVWQENGLPDEAIMDLLENCGLAAPVDTQGKVHSVIGKKGEKVKEYFVPSALPLCSDSELRLSTQNSACTLHLLFNTRYVPPGYLIRLVTALSKNKQCRISFAHGMYRNQFMLHFAGDEQNYIDEITISQHIMSVHVNVNRSGQRRPPIPPFSTTCREIMKIILKCSSEIEQWLPSIKVSTALACTKCSSNDHFIEIDPDTTTTLSQLTCQSNKVCTFNPSQQHWLQIQPKHEKLALEDVITETELQCIAEEVSRNGKFKELAEALEMTRHLQGNVTAYELLQRWKCEMQQTEFSIHIKYHLMYHLRCINLQDTADRLRYHQLQSYAEKFKEQKRRWLLCMYSGTIIIAIVAIILGVLLNTSNTQSGNNMRMDKESWRAADYNIEHFHRMYDRPTLNELHVLNGRDGDSVRILERIGNRYSEFGTYLLSDEHGVLLKTIETNANGKVEAINREILTRWINGEGIKDVNWKTLIHALRVGPKLNTLADDIVAALEAHDKDKTVA